MKRALLFIYAVALFSSCNQQNPAFQSASDRADRARQDSITIVDSLLAINDLMDKSDHMSKASFIDTTGLYLAPVTVIKAYTFQEEYSSYYSIRLSFKNVSKKTIEGIRFEWYGENTFGEPAEMGSYVSQGYGGGFTDDKLKPGSSTSAVWSILSKDGKKVIAARAKEVAFTDGTKWSRK